MNYLLNNGFYSQRKETSALYRLWDKGKLAESFFMSDMNELQDVISSYAKHLLVNR